MESRSGREIDLIGRQASPWPPSTINQPSPECRIWRLSRAAPWAEAPRCKQEASWRESQFMALQRTGRQSIEL
jgi:hypothetical protein